MGRTGGQRLALKAFVLDDQPQVRELLSESLSDLGGITTVGTAGNERAAIAWLRDPQNQWDIAVIDLVLEPGGNGLRVLEALRGRKSTQKMVVLTGTASPEVRRRCEAMGADGVFDKAMETEAMLDYCVALARAAGGH
jgi:DNA-binding NarL/FixJ family response regulator